MQKTDLARCFEIYPPIVEAARPKQALCIWEQLLKSPGFKGAVVEDHLPGGRAMIVGFGAGVFVSEDFAQQEIREARPGLHARVMAHFAAHSNSVLSIEQIGDDNAGNGLKCHSSCRPVGARLKCRRNCRRSGSSGCRVCRITCGILHRRMLTELMDTQDLEFALASRLWRAIPYKACGVLEHRHLGIIETPDVRAVAGSALGPLFRRQAPQLFLRHTDQELLLVALEGATDEEIAVRLHITVPAVKRRWEDIYERVYSSGIDVGFSWDALAVNGKRGAQKRHILLAYLRRHPEELRPYRSRARIEAVRSA